MALKPCRECGQQVSTDAETCPHCGVRSPTATRGLYWGRIAAVLLVLIGIAALFNSGSGDKSKGSAEKPKPEENPQMTECRSDWTKCTDNKAFVNDSGRWLNVKVRCGIATEERVRYGSPKWPSGIFGSYLEGDSYIKTGIVEALEPDVQIQNQFGAWEHMQVECKYDIKTKTVLDITIMSKQ